jgi:hypothetical protein
MLIFDLRPARAASYPTVVSAVATQKTTLPPVPFDMACRTESAEIAGCVRMATFGQRLDVVGVLGNPVTSNGAPHVCARRAAFALARLSEHAQSVASVAPKVVWVWSLVACGLAPALGAFAALDGVSAARCWTEPQRHYLARGRGL